MCLEETLINDYKKPVRPFPYKEFKEVIGFMLNFHHSFKLPQNIRTFAQYIKIAYKLPYKNKPECSKSFDLYKFIMKDIIPEK